MWRDGRSRGERIIVAREQDRRRARRSGDIDGRKGGPVPSSPDLPP